MRSKAEAFTTTTAIPTVNKADAASTSIIRLIRKRLPEIKFPTTSDVLGKLTNGTLVNETVQPTGEVTEESFISAETAIVELRDIRLANVNLVPTANLTESTAPTSTVLPTTTTTVSTTTSTSSNKPPWRVRMELNQSNRRGQSTTAKPVVDIVIMSSSSLPQQSIGTTTLPSVDKQEFIADARNSSAVTAFIIPSGSSLESSQNENSPLSSVVIPPLITSSIVTNSPNSRPIQSSRIAVASSQSPPTPVVLWTPIVRLPVTGSRNIPSGTLKIQITSTRLAISPVTSSTPNPELMESIELTDTESEEEENVVQPISSSSTTSARIYPPTTTEAPTTVKTSTVTTKKAPPPTPIMHTLEDILQRLVPARDHDNYGGGSSNPFLTNPAIVVPTAEDANEIVSIGDPVLRASVGISRTGTINDSSDQSSNGNNWTDAINKDNQAATTSIYIVGVVAVIPLAGLILWIVRVQLHKRREVNEPSI